MGRVLGVGESRTVDAKMNAQWMYGSHHRESTALYNLPVTVTK